MGIRYLNKVITIYTIALVSTSRPPTIGVSVHTQLIPRSLTRSLSDFTEEGISAITDQRSYQLPLIIKTNLTDNRAKSKPSIANELVSSEAKQKTEHE